VILPFLPGDSILFVAGAFAAQGTFSLAILFPLLAVAAIAGDSANYAVGSLLRKRGIDSGHLRFVKREHLERTQAFFERHGPKTIVLARFVPVVRTLAPFVAALGSMSYRRFFVYNVVGGLAWVAALLAAGRFFGAGHRRLAGGTWPEQELGPGLNSAVDRARLDTWSTSRKEDIVYFPFPPSESEVRLPTC
jgi:membrane-associated protein